MTIEGAYQQIKEWELPFYAELSRKKVLETIEEYFDAVPVVPGHWIGEDYDGYADGNPVYYTYRCSECGKLFETDDEPLDFDYCPHCGAKMDGDSDETD